MTFALSIQHHVSPPHSSASFKTKSRYVIGPSAHCILTYSTFLFQHLPLSFPENTFLFLWKSMLYCLKSAISKFSCKSIWNLKIKPVSAGTQNYTAIPKQKFILLSLQFFYECNWAVYNIFRCWKGKKRCSFIVLWGLINEVFLVKIRSILTWQMQS